MIYIALLPNLGNRAKIFEYRRVYLLLKSIYKNDKYAHWGYIFVLPFCVVMAIFLLYPIFTTLYLSFTDWKGGIASPNFVGLDNYAKLLKDITTGGFF